MLLANRNLNLMQRSRKLWFAYIFEQGLHNKAVKKPGKLVYKECYKLLDVNEGCSQQELRESFLELARKYHPDSDSPFSDANKFAEIEVAYRILKEKLVKEGQEENENIEKDFGIKHTAPQHRQYLSHEGVGSGTPSQRLKQYQNYRVARAVENVLEHRMLAAAAKNENALVVKDKQAARKHKIRNALDRLVEDLIQESMNKGEFDNLPGQGKPLNYSNYNPYIDSTTHKLNEVLINNGFTPTWILLQKEIQQDKKQLRLHLQETRNYFGEFPLSKAEQDKWEASVERLHSHIQIINEKINKYNLLVPFLYKQIAPVQLQREAEKILRASPLKNSNSDSLTEKKTVTSEKHYNNFFTMIEMLFTNKKP